MISLAKMDQLIQRAKKIESRYPYMALYADGSSKTYNAGELIQILSRTGSGIVEVKQIPGTPKEGEMLGLLNGLVDSERGNDETDESSKD